MMKFIPPRQSLFDDYRFLLQAANWLELNNLMLISCIYSCTKLLFYKFCFLEKMIQLKVSSGVILKVGKTENKNYRAVGSAAIEETVPLEVYFQF